jgi:hypothetical protein
MVSYQKARAHMNVPVVAKKYSPVTTEGLRNVNSVKRSKTAKNSVKQKPWD